MLVLVVFRISGPLSRRPPAGELPVEAILPIEASRRWKLALLLGAFVGALAATGFGAYAAASGGNTINACAMKATGLLRVSPNGKCLPSEQALQWNQTGPPGPPGPAGASRKHRQHRPPHQPASCSTARPRPPRSSPREVRSGSSHCPVTMTRTAATARSGSPRAAIRRSKNRVIFYSPQVASSPTLVNSEPGGHVPLG